MIKKAVLSLFFVIIAVSLFMSYNNYFIGSKENKSVTLLFVADDDQTENKILKIFLMNYFPDKKCLKILFVDENIYVSGIKNKKKLLNMLYFEKQKDLRKDFVINEIRKIFDGKITVDNYIQTELSVLYDFISLYRNRNRNIYDSAEYSFVFEDRKSELVYYINTADFIAKNTDRNIIKDLCKFYKNNAYRINADISVYDMLKIYGITESNNKLYFADMPVVRKKNRNEYDFSAVNDIYRFFVCEDENMADNGYNIKVEVMNASSKPRLASKAVDRLREYGFDIFEWGSLKKNYETTIITDLCGNYAKAAEIKNILGCGYIIFIPHRSNFADISVVLGKDCDISDKLDKKNIETEEIYEKN